MDFVILTGMSGAGRTQTTKFLEDLGYFCIDNIPTILLPKFGDLYERGELHIERLAIVMDVRGGDFVDEMYHFTDRMRALGVNVRILFLDSSDDTLINRHKENKKMHPLAGDGDNSGAVAKERAMLQGLREHADFVIDTTGLSVWDLKKEINSIFGDENAERNMRLHIVSFGYKYGVPPHADLMFDVRFLPNPYYVRELRDETGNDEGVREYVLSNEDAKSFVEMLTQMLKFLLPRYKAEGKEVLVTSIGCTGGRHRSVAIANELCRIFSEEQLQVSLSHRDIGK